MSELNRSIAPLGTSIAPRRNLQSIDRGLSILAGSIVGILAARRKGTSGLLIGILGTVLVARGVSGSSPAKRLLGQKPDEDSVAEEAGWSNAALLSRAVTINAPRETVFSRFRDLASWPEWAESVESINMGANSRLHFVMNTAAGKADWEAEITGDEDGRLLAIGTIEGAELPVTMRYEFRDAPGGRGTEIHGTIAYEAPGGSLARYAAKLTEREPGIQLRRDLKRFKSLIETGEIAVSGPQGAEPKA